MSWRVLEWQPLPGFTLPDPVIVDDRAKFPVDVTKNVLAWLEKTKPKFESRPPTPITIELSAGIPRNGTTPSASKTIYWFGPGVREQFRFRHHTVEFLLKDEKRALVARYRYLAASTDDHRTIVGPQLRILPCH